MEIQKVLSLSEIIPLRRIRYKKVRKVQPNTFEYTGVHSADKVEMQLFEYNEAAYREFTDIRPGDIESIIDNYPSDKILWFNIHGLHDTEMIRQLGEILNVENYIIGEILNTSRRSRVEELEDVVFFSVKSILNESDSEIVRVEQISFLLKGNLLVSFQEKKSDFYAHIRERIRTNSGTVRKRGSDYLMYLMLEATMENFFISIENVEARIEKLIIKAKSNDAPEVLEEIEKSREELHFLKRCIIPLRDALYALKSSQMISIQSSGAVMIVYFTRLHQKSLELLDQIDYDLNSLESTSNVFFSVQNQRMNQIMKTLTIFSVIFMPLTFIVGVYGMNFENIPEFRSANGYYYVLTAMSIIAIGMIIYFKNKKWF